MHELYEELGSLPKEIAGKKLLQLFSKEEQTP